MQRRLQHATPVATNCRLQRVGACKACKGNNPQAVSLSGVWRRFEPTAELPCGGATSDWSHGGTRKQLNATERAYDGIYSLVDVIYVALVLFKRYDAAAHCVSQGCIGDGRAANDEWGHSHNWVFSPHSCRLKFHGGSELQYCLRRQQIGGIVTWGDSLAHEAGLILKYAMRRTYIAASELNASWIAPPIPAHLHIGEPWGDCGARCTDAVATVSGLVAIFSQASARMHACRDACAHARG